MPCKLSEDASPQEPIDINLIDDSHLTIYHIVRMDTAVPAITYV